MYSKNLKIAAILFIFIWIVGVIITSININKNIENAHSDFEELEYSNSSTSSTTIENSTVYYNAVKELIENVYISDLKLNYR